MTHEINLEAETHGDILMADFVDSYNNLTLKSLHALKYFLSLKFSHMLKVDDDCFVNFNPLLSLLQSKYLQPYVHTFILRNIFVFFL